MNVNSFSQKFLDFYNIKSIQQPVISSTGVVLSKLVFIPIGKDGIPFVSGYLYSATYLKWLFKHGEKLAIMDDDAFSHMIGVQVL